MPFAGCQGESSGALKAECSVKICLKLSGSWSSRRIDSNQSCILNKQIQQSREADERKQDVRRVKCQRVYNVEVCQMSPPKETKKPDDEATSQT